MNYTFTGFALVFYLAACLRYGTRHSKKWDVVPGAGMRGTVSPTFPGECMHYMYVNYVRLLLFSFSSRRPQYFLGPHHMERLPHVPHYNYVCARVCWLFL